MSSFRASHGSPRLLLLHTDGRSTFGSHLIDAGVDNVVELRYQIANTVALTFCRDFYKGVVAGESLDTAVQRARVNISLHGFGSGESRFFGAPVYYTNSVEPTHLVSPPVSKPSLPRSV